MSRAKLKQFARLRKFERKLNAKQDHRIERQQRVSNEVYDEAIRDAAREINVGADL